MLAAMEDSTNRASQQAHHTPKKAGTGDAFQSMAPVWGSELRYSSLIVWNGMTKLANGISHQATAHVGVKRRPCTPSVSRFDCERCCQINHTMPVATTARTATP